LQTEVLNDADSVCRAKSHYWMQRLRRCPAIETMATSTNSTIHAQWVIDSTWLSKYLVKICTPGVDYMGHPAGAASLPDGTTTVYFTENPNNVTISGVGV